MLFQSLSFAEKEQNTTFEMKIDKEDQKIEKEVNITIKGKNIKNMYAYEVALEYENKKVQFIKGTSAIKGFSASAKRGETLIIFGNTKVGNAIKDEGNLDLCTLKFKILKEEKATFTLKSANIINILSPGETSEEKFPTSVSVSVNEKSKKEVHIFNTNFKEIENHWAKSSVELLVSKGIVSGYSDGTFRPEKNLTRAEAIVIVLKTAEIAPIQNANIITPDASEVPEWSKGYVQSAVNEGFISGYKDGTLRMNNDITREEILAMILKATKSNLSTSNTLNFKDMNDISEWAIKYVETAVTEKLINGYPDNTFRGRNNITRAEISVIVSKLLK